MSRKHFTIWHSLEGLGILLVVEYALLHVLPGQLWLLILYSAAAVGAIGTAYVSTEVIEEVKSSWHMLLLLSVTTTEFVAFFAFQYSFLITMEPGSFANMPFTFMSVALNSVMIFVFNPIYLPTSESGQALLLINTLGALGLVLFLLQNIGQFRKSVQL